MILEVEGGRPLSGVIRVDGAKNAALPLMAASLLTSGVVRLEGAPRLSDVAILRGVLEALGVEVAEEASAGVSALVLRAGRVSATKAPWELVSQMRAAFWVIGPLLARYGEARVALPGGCAIGARPVDFYIEAMRAMGARVDNIAGEVVARAPRGGLRGARIAPAFPSVGLTHVAMMMGVLARGETTIVNAAREPEVVALGEALVAMGARIEGLGTATISVAPSLGEPQGATLRVPADRIETGSWMMAALATDGALMLEGASLDGLDAAVAVLRQAGGDVRVENRGVRVARAGSGLRACDAATSPHPGFPTDLQPQYMALAAGARGVSTIEERVFENRLSHAQELNRLGADISVSGRRARVRGVARLEGAPVRAGDLRAGMALAIAGLAAQGCTRIHDGRLLDRGYARLEAKIEACGGRARRLDS